MTMTPQDKTALVRTLSNDLAAFLYTLPEDVWRDADIYASACDRWNMADVVAHLIDVAITFTMSVERALGGSVSPPMGYRPKTAEERIQSVVSLREAYDEDLFPEFNTSCLRLNRLIAELEPAQHELPAWHPFGESTIGRLIELRAMELAIHGWDIRSGIDRDASIAPVAIPFLKGWVARWLRAAFRPPAELESAACLRFELTDSPNESRDLIVRADGFDLSDADASATPDATLALDSSAYILFLMGRIDIRRALRRRRLSLTGDRAAAERFGMWFPGV